MMNENCILCLLNSGCPDQHTKDTHDKLNSQIHSFRKGHVLFHQDQPNEGLYYIIEGVVKIYSLSESGKRIIHALLPSGDLAGISALPDGRLSPYTAEVIEDAKLCILERQDVFELFRTQPAFMNHILHKITKSQEDAYHRNDNLINSRGRERMAKCLLELGECFGEQNENKLRIKLRLNREDLASVIGVAPETAIRLISEFKRNQLLTEDDRQIIILDVKAMKEVCEKKFDEKEAEMLSKNSDNFYSDRRASSESGWENK